jgi:hypothetical protein
VRGSFIDDFDRDYSVYSLKYILWGYFLCGHKGHMAVKIVNKAATHKIGWGTLNYAQKKRFHNWSCLQAK